MADEMSNAEIARRLTELTTVIGRIDEKVTRTVIWQERHEERHKGVDGRYDELKSDIKELKDDRVAQAKERVAASRFRWGTGVTMLGIAVAAIIELIGRTHG